MSKITKIAGLALLALGVTGACFAVPVPEVDASMGVNALALLGGAALVIRSRKR